MGNNNAKILRPDQISNTVNNTIVNTIMKSFQTSTADVNQTQVLNIGCDTDVVAYNVQKSNECRQNLTKANIKTDIIKNVCMPIINCSGTNISFQSSLNVSTVSNQSSTIISTFNTNIKNEISQQIDSINTTLSLLTQPKIKQTINNLNDTIQTNSTTIVQNIIDTISQTQTLSLNNYAVHYLTMNSVSNIVNSSIQNVESIQSQITSLSNEISQILQNDTKKDSLSSIINTVIIWFFGIVLLLFLFFYFLKKDFMSIYIQATLPYLIFFLLLFIIYYIQLAIKPSYILDTSNTVNNTKLICYMILYAFGLFIIELVYFKYYKRK